MGLIVTMQDGQHYMKVWPNKKELAALFPEGRVIAATKLALQTMPPIAVISSFMIVNHFGQSFLPQALAIGLFFLSLPVQGLVWLGHRSQQPLNPSLRSWYQEIYQQMQQHGCALQSIPNRPKYLELAKLLRTAFDELDKVFTEKWF